LRSLLGKADKTNTKWECSWKNKKMHNGKSAKAHRNTDKLISKQPFTAADFLGDIREYWAQNVHYKDNLSLSYKLFLSLCAPSLLSPPKLQDTNESASS
jgi:hypothetical protein